MNGKQYWKDKIPIFIINIVCMVLLSVFLFFVGNNVDSIAVILIIWTMLLAGVLTFTYHQRKRRLNRLVKMAEGLEEKYLLSEMLPEPEHAEEQVYFQLLKMASKSMLEQIGTVARERQEYREYIEQWIHEIKTPITAMKLLCENHKEPFTRELMRELEKTNRFTEQALYYARSEYTEKDYSVQEIRLFDVVHQAIADNKYLLLQNQVALETEESELTVYSDDKWLRFILDQLIVNAVKYSREHPVLHFYTKVQGDQIFLFVEDHGIGICANDLKGGWEFPGGKIEPNETPEAAIVREIKEELDTEVQVIELLDTVEYDYPKFHLSMDCFVCQVRSGDLVLKEHKAAVWLTKDALYSVDWLPADRVLIEKIEKVI